MTRNHRPRGGFTLIEILLVIVIIGMLAGVLVVTIGGTREGAEVDTTKLMIQKIENKIQTYYMHVGHYPTDGEGPTVRPPSLTEAGHGLAADVFLERSRGVSAAAPDLAVCRAASLARFGGVDALESDALTVDLDRVGIDHRRLASDLPAVGC